MVVSIPILELGKLGFRKVHDCPQVTLTVHGVQEFQPRPAGLNTSHHKHLLQQPAQQPTSGEFPLKM